MSFVVAALFFLKFWRRTRDRLFAFFALSFFVLAINRVAMVLFVEHEVKGDVFYWVRFAAFALILVGILDKNRSK